jgi:GNAT superfamily N-acetyltransferase
MGNSTTAVPMPATAVSRTPTAAEFLSDAALLVATRGEEVVGLIATCLVPRMDEDRLSCRITDLVVAARHRRQGIGSALLRAAASRARSAGAGRLDLSTGDARSDAHAFYERLGFSDNARALTRRLDEALSASPPAHGTPR